MPECWPRIGIPTALRELSEVVKRFGDAAGEAKKLLAKLRRDPVAMAAIKSASEAGGKEKSESMAARSLKSARRLIEDNLAGGYESLRGLARRYPKTQAAAEATQEADRLWADPEKRSMIQSAVSSRKAEGLLRLALNFMSNGANDRARSLLDLSFAIFGGRTRCR